MRREVCEEVREEVGVEVGAVTHVTSQPLPFPNSLMIGSLRRARRVDDRGALTMEVLVVAAVVVGLFVVPRSVRRRTRRFRRNPAERSTRR